MTVRSRPHRAISGRSAIHSGPSGGIPLNGALHHRGLVIDRPSRQIIRQQGAASEKRPAPGLL